jgi:hypothetical protein
MIDLLTRTPHRYDLDLLTGQLRDRAVELGRKVHAEGVYSSFMFCLAWLDHRGDEHLTEYACRIQATYCKVCKRWGIWFEVRLSAPGSEPIDIGPPPTCPTCTWRDAWEQTFKTIALAYLSEPFVNLISRVERVVRAGQDLDYSAKYWTDL